MRIVVFGTNPARFTMQDLASVALRKTGLHPPIELWPIRQGVPEKRRPDTPRPKKVLGLTPKCFFRLWLPAITTIFGRFRSIAAFR
jgi:nucleoside-diphosphate-sugar epimerase